MQGPRHHQQHAPRCRMVKPKGMEEFMGEMKELLEKGDKRIRREAFELAADTLSEWFKFPHQSWPRTVLMEEAREIVQRVRGLGL